MAEQYAPIREKGSPHVNIEEMHPAHRDMLLVRHDFQLLWWARHDRTDVPTAGKVANELGGYFCDDRRFGRMDIALTHGGKASREQEQESFFQRTARQTSTFPSRTCLISVRGES